jgi:hypothetical protein
MLYATLVGTLIGVFNPCTVGMTIPVPVVCPWIVGNGGVVLVGVWVEAIVGVLVLVGRNNAVCVMFAWMV